MPDLLSTIQTQLLDKYLRDPYIAVDEADVVTNHEFGITFIHADRPPIGATAVFLSGLQFRDMSGDGRPDLLVPARLSDGRIVNLLYQNLPHFLDTQTNHYGSPQMLPTRFQPAANEPNSLIDIAVDLNGDGLVDLVDVTALGGVLFLSNIRINLGVGFVQNNVRTVIRDARLGYIASYAQTLLANFAEGPPATPTPPNPSIATPLPPAHEQIERLRFADDELSDLRQFSSEVSIPVDPGTPEPNTAASFSLPPNAPVSNILARHTELDFDVITRGHEAFLRPQNNEPQTFVPNPVFYAFGIQRGSEHAAADLETFRRAQNTFSLHAQALEPLNNISPTSPTPERERAVDSILRLGAGAERVGTLQDINGPFSRAWSTVLNSPVFLPRIFDDNLQAIPGAESAPTLDVDGGANFLDESQVRQRLNQLDRNYLVRNENNGRLVLNGGRVVGMALAFMNLNVMRSDPRYIERLQVAQEAAAIQRNADDLTDLLSPRLFLLASEPNINQLQGFNMVMGSLSSGFNDLPQLITNDVARVAFDQGFIAGRAEALRIIRVTLGEQIPGLNSAADIESAARIIGQVIRLQQLEIGRLNNAIRQLERTVELLNRSLENANNLISDLRETNRNLNELLIRLQGTADAATRLLNAGTGFLIGGPIGALACVLFC